MSTKTEAVMVPDRRFRHKKRGTEYTLIGVGRAQGRLNDDDPVVLYRGDEDGGLWVRHQAEFCDGRFEDLAARPATAASVGVEEVAQIIKAELVFCLTSEPDASVEIENADHAARAILASLRSPEPGGGWRTIESAPKDGTQVVLWCVKPDVQDYRSGGHPLAVIGNWDENCWNIPFSDDWVSDDGFTHWMPLPASPSEEG